MSKKSLTLSGRNMVSTSKIRGNLRNNAITCSTPEHDSPSRDSDSICDSETTSPVPFFCTQDGVDGETDVVWNYYTPKADATNSRIKNSTPNSRRTRKSIVKIPTSRPIQRRRVVKPSQKHSEILQELVELNQNIYKFIEKKPERSPLNKLDSDEDIFNNSSSLSPKSGLRNNNRCLRKNLLSSKFNKPEPETALESDDSMNECLFRASQIVEDKIKTHIPVNSYSKTNIQDSVDNILCNINLETPKTKFKKKIKTPCINNDSFDNIVGNLNDSALERLTQMPVNSPIRENTFNKSSITSDWVLQDMTIHDSSMSPRKVFARHSSMPESPTVVVQPSKPSTSGMIFGRYNSMPHNKDQKTAGDSPIRCTPDEIRKKHHQAREKLLAKRLLPFTSTQQSFQCTQDSNQGRQAIKKLCIEQKPAPLPDMCTKANEVVNVKSLIEKKRQEALMKLRRKQPR